VSPRLLWIHQNFVTAREAGNSRAIHLLAELLASGWTVDLICSQETYLGLPATRSGSDDVIIENDGNLFLHRLPKVTRGTYLRRSGRAYFEFNTRALAHARRLPRPDVVYATSPPTPQLLPSLWIAAALRVPLVFEVRDLWPAFLLDGGLLRRGIVSEALSALEVLGCRVAAACVTTSPVFTPYLEQLGARAVCAAPTGADSELSRADVASGKTWRERSDLTGRIVVLYTGSLNEAYGIPIMLQAAQQCSKQDPRIVWVFAGAGRDAPLIQSAAAQFGYIRWLGTLPKDTLTPVLMAADIAVQTHADWPLLETTVSGKLFDYMAAGLPIVSVSRGLTGEILNAAGAGVVSEVTADGLAHQILAFANLEATERKTIGAAGRSWVRRYVPSERCARSIVAVLERARAAPPLTPTKLFGSSIAAVRSVAAREPSRTISQLYGSTRATTIRAAFDSWIADGVSKTAAVPAAAMPAVLSTRSDTVAR
jgi:glycosyltransferase involved in cell wall biosynthesis